MKYTELFFTESWRTFPVSLSSGVPPRGGSVAYVGLDEASLSISDSAADIAESCAGADSSSGTYIGNHYNNDVTIWSLLEILS